MAALDTNILIRYLVADDAAQAGAAKRLIRRAVGANETLHVPITVALELEWVLRASFDFDKQVVIQTFVDLLATSELSFESEGALEVALALYRRGSADFSDCLHIALAGAAGQQPLWTFDRAVARVDGASFLPTR